MQKFIAILGTLDTKGAEIKFLRDAIEQRGHKPIVIDLGTFTPSFTPDISNKEVAEAGGISIEDARTKKIPRPKFVDAMIAGGIKKLTELLAAGKLDAVIAVGGASMTDMGTRIMQALPFGIPKLMVSSIAGMSYTPRFFQECDMTVMGSVVDITGLNELVKDVLTRAAGAICGFAEASMGPTIKRLKEIKKPLVAITGFGYSEFCTEEVRKLLEERGYQTIRFHAQGVGDRAMEALIRQGLFDGVVDIVPAGVSEELLGGNRAAGPTRLEAAGERGIPQVITPCGFEMISCGPIERRDRMDPLWVSRKLAERKLYIHDALRVQARTTAEELREVAKVVANKLNKAKGPVKFLIPRKGWSSISIEGEALYDPETDAVFVEELKKHLKPEIEVIELDTHLNTPEFAKAVADTFDSMMKQVRTGG